MALPANRLAGLLFSSRKHLFVVVITIVTVILLLGPRPGVESEWVEPRLGPDLDAYLTESERDVPSLRPGDAKSVVWRDPDTRERTEVSIVYLHGFSADRHEVEPLITELAHDLQANVYFTRLSGHGRDGAGMSEPSAADWLVDTAEAIAIGGRIGEKVVLVATSTGGTLALWAATQERARGRLSALVLISPNLGLRDRLAPVLLWPWGSVLARLVLGPERCFEPRNAYQAAHWTTCYPPGALLPMMALVEHVKTVDLGVIEIPTLVIYSPKDEIVDAIETERVILTLRPSLVSTYLVEESGDPENHVLAGDAVSPGTTDQVRARILATLKSGLR